MEFEKVTETPARKFNYRKWGILVSVLTIIAVMLISLFVVVPFTFGDRYVSTSVDLDFLLGPGDPPVEVVYTNGSLIRVCFFGFNVNVTNSYFAPAYIRYNGLDLIILVYNRTVVNPEDVEGNKPFLVWGAFYAEPFSFGTDLCDSYDYYADHKDLSNFTRRIPVGTTTYASLFEMWPAPHWWGQNCFTNEPVSTGTYFIYATAFGKVSAPFNLEIGREGFLSSSPS